MAQGRVRHSTGSPRRRAMTMIETVISLVVVSVMMVAALKTVAAAAKSRQVHSSQRRGPALARQLLAEVLPNVYAEPNGTATLGPEAGETGHGRAGFDDVDDYDGWSASPPQAPDGTVLSSLAGWRRSVTVRYVDPEDPDRVVGSDSGLKKITVTVTDPQSRRTVHSALRSRYGIYDQAPAQETTYVTWVGLELQMGPDAGGRVAAGANPLNRIPAQGQ